MALAPKYSLQYWAVASGGNSLQENTSMKARSVSSAKWPAMQDVSMSWIRFAVGDLLVVALSEVDGYMQAPLALVVVLLDRVLVAEEWA